LIKTVTYEKTSWARTWEKNNALLKELKPLHNTYTEITEWSQWAFDKAEPKELTRYFQDVNLFEGKLIALEVTQEARELKESWLAALKALKLAVRTKMAVKEPSEIITETGNLVDEIDRAEKSKEPLTEKLADAEDMDEDLAEDILSNAQKILEQKLRDLRNNSQYADTSSLTAAWQELDTQFNSRFETFSEEYGG